MKSTARAFSLALLLATVAGCAVVPIGPPVYVGAQINSGPHYARPYYGPNYGPYYGPRWRRY